MVVIWEERLLKSSEQEKMRINMAERVIAGGKLLEIGQILEKIGRNI